MKFDWKKPTVEMLGRWQPWHKGHQELFKKCHSITGQVAIMVRKVPKNKEANKRVPGQDDNPFNFEQIYKNIIENLSKDGFEIEKDYIIMEVPNIVDISHGRKVGYTFTKHDLGKNIHSISGTKIRKSMKKKD